MKNWRVGAIKVARRGAAIPSAVRRSPWQLSHSPPPGTCQHNTKTGEWNEYLPKINVGGREGKKRASFAKQMQAKAHGNAPADLPGAPHII